MRSAKDLEYISKEDFTQFEIDAGEVVKLISGIIRPAEDRSHISYLFLILPLLFSKISLKTKGG